MFTINGETWYVLAVPENHSMLVRSDGTYAIGACDDNTKTIYINNQVRGKLLKKVLCHEITHSAMFSYNVELSHEQEELLADLIATYGEEIISITNKFFQKIKEGY